jgi:hypothetical protein
MFLHQLLQIDIKIYGEYGRIYSSIFFHICTERDGRKGPPAGNKAKCNRTNTPHSKATLCKAKPNQKPQTHTRGERQA